MAFLDLELPKITIDDLLKNAEDLEQTSIWMLFTFTEKDIEVEKIQGEFMKVYVGAVCQTAIYRIIRALLSHNEAKSLAQKILDKTQEIYIKGLPELLKEKKEDEQEI